MASIRQRLSAEERRGLLLDAGAELFAERAYDDVLMDDVSARAGVSRALLYRHFPGKRELFAGVYARAAERLLAASPVDPALPLPDQVRAGLDAHLDWFEANRRTVLAANRTLAGDPTVQAIIGDELTVLRERLVAALDATGQQRELLSSVLMSWLVFVRLVTVDWLASGAGSREQIRELCTDALLAALKPVLS